MQIKKIFQIAAVFIGTIVGAGLASGQEITQFFTSYGWVGFIGILITGILYIPVGSAIVKVSNKYNLNSYNELIALVCPGSLGKITDVLMSFFLLSGAAIILAGGGALLHQYFGISKWVGIIIMSLTALLALLNDTDGLIFINSIIVPSLITVIIVTFVFFCMKFSDNITIHNIMSSNTYRVEIIPNQWIFSTFLYAGFNLLCCSGVLVPLSKETKNKNTIIPGIIIGAVGLTLVAFLVNIMLTLNIPEIYKYEIPLMFISTNLSKLLQIFILLIIWFEMFSTEVSDIYSISKTLVNRFNISYKSSVFIILLVAIPISQIGFTTLIKFLYPGFGVVSLIFIFCLFKFNHENKI